MLYLLSSRIEGLQEVIEGVWDGVMDRAFVKHRSLRIVARFQQQSAKGQTGKAPAAQTHR